MDDFSYPYVYRSLVGFLFTTVVLAIPHEGEADGDQALHVLRRRRAHPWRDLGRPIEQVLPLQIYRDKNDQALA
jgi:hypothetical protein